MDKLFSDALMHLHGFSPLNNREMAILEKFYSALNSSNKQLVVMDSRLHEADEARIITAEDSFKYIELTNKKSEHEN